MDGLVFVIVYVVIALCAFACFIVNNRVKTNMQKYNTAAEKIIREDLLAYSLKNPYASGVKEVAPKSRRIMIGITTKPHKHRLVFDPTKNVYFGRSDQNQIIIYDRSVSKTHGCIFLQENKVWLNNMSKSKKITVKRGLFKKLGMAPGRTVRLRDGDKIFLNSTRLSVKLFMFDINHK